jgi:hypothetical protein
MRLLLTMAATLALTLGPLPAAEPLAGRFNGEWTGTAAGGKFLLVLEPAEAGKWNCQVTFTIGELEVKTTVTSVRVDGPEVEARYEFNLGENRLESTINGRLDGRRLEGKYRTKALPSGDPVDEGAWKAARES